MAQHPEVTGCHTLEPGINEQLEYASVLKLIDHATESELRQVCRLMAKQNLLMYPAALRYLAAEAANNLSGSMRWQVDHEAIAEEVLGPAAAGQ